MHQPTPIHTRGAAGEGGSGNLSVTSGQVKVVNIPRQQGAWPRQEESDDSLHYVQATV
ncbi:hypothetical protein BT69DRAFT_465313 [Atractiella rhizophila]|nr:hypothetical protein BT69DRAFT_465313 [Atractiella rhizophila]